MSTDILIYFYPHLGMCCHAV